MHKLIIIGSGPAGLMAAIAAGRAMGSAQGKILLLEGNPACGAKLLLSGSGQCNYTNNLPTDDFLARCNEYANYLKPSFYAFNNQAFLRLLQESGVDSLIRSDHKVFPASLQASEVREALLKQALAAGADVRYNALVSSVAKQADSSFRLTLNSGKTLECEKLIIATGGASYPQTGSDGIALRLAKALGHKPIPFRPHLTNVALDSFDRFKACAGVSLSDVEIRVTGEHHKFKVRGDLLFTHNGLSGPVILDNSYRLEKEDLISVSYLNNAQSLFNDLQKTAGNHSVINALKATGLPARLLQTLCEINCIPTHIPFRDLPQNMRKGLMAILTYWPFKISSLGNMGVAMASAGGVPLPEVNAKTMASRVCPGLFFAGEILDYALPTGGFNIQIAASTGWLAGSSVVK
ncbi:MAG: aminoacetone oxidase family FAD-binding enzyme [Candidatus Cloacimonas sp.]|jgi:predicted Rossmann fold flavoprotein|nr:aminoacetone oxidase family FAD-binding enzyme [Candidatus Cloacimonas sp.]